MRNKINRPLSQPAFKRKMPGFSSERSEKRGGDPIGSSTSFEDLAAEKTGILAEGRLGERSNTSTTTKDTTECRNEIQALKSEDIQSGFRRLYDSNLIGIIFWDTDGNIRQANDKFLQITGYSRKEILSGKMRWKDMTPPEYASVDSKAIEEIAATGVSTPFRKEYICKDGHRVPVLLSAASIEGRNDIGICFVQDLTEQTNLVQKLTESYAELEEKVRIRTQNLKDSQTAVRNVLEDLQVEKEALAMAKAKDNATLASIGDGIIATDPDKKIVTINKAAEKLLGWKASEVIGKNYDDVISLEDEKGTFVPLNERPLIKAFTRSTIITTSSLFIFNKRNKTKFPVAITVSPIILDNKTIGAVEVFRDITREQEIDKAKTEFVSLVSHQLRTPLTAISWYSEMILNGDVGEVMPDQKRYLEEINQGDRRMIELVNTILNVSRIETGTFKVEPRLTNIITLAQTAISGQSPKIEEKKVIIIQKFDDDIPKLSTDPKLLSMVFQNLLSNSINYTSPGGKVEFSIYISPGRGKGVKKNVLIKVSDTGYGIPKKQQSQIFTKFFRADNIRGKEAVGTGLGLYIVKSIVENLGGKIWFESKENKGTTFSITFPLKTGPK